MTVNLEELVDQLRQLIEEKNYRAVRRILADVLDADIAELFEQLEADERTLIFRILPKDQAADVFAYLSASQRMEIVDSIKASHLDKILDELSFDDKIDFLEEMPASFVRRIIDTSDEPERRLINQFLNYPDNCAGTLMTIEYVALKKEMTVRDAFRQIRETGLDKETIYTCYVLDSTRRLEGIVSLRHLVLSEMDEKLEDLMQGEIVMVQTLDDQEEVASVFKKYDLVTVPVVDRENRMVGIITIDDIIDVIEQENTEDFHKMAAIVPTEEQYMDAGVFTLARKRILWLLLLMISASFTGRIIGGYEEVLSSMIVLSTFIPMLMDSAGNAGSQSSTLIIRGLAVGDIELKDWYKVFFKELRVSVMVGIILGLVNYLRLFFFENVDPMVNLTVCLTLVCTIIMAKLIGGMLPMIAKRVKMDPAIMAGPLITTIVDALSLIIYFRVATWLLDII